MTDLMLPTSLPSGKPLTLLSRVCAGRLRQGLLLYVILRETQMPKAFSATSFWVTHWLSLRCLPVAKHLAHGYLEMNLTLSAWTANIGTDPFQSREGPELTIERKNVPLLLVHELSLPVQVKKTCAVVCGVQVCVCFTAVNVG